ncbi:biofilm PGA synthesis N-glycosyltransferase PgaC [Crenobacter luteus]|uniref:Poly-beta-1,6-N-acetyl-D-glucosamine synthase n=1 Tax=Crenobacter luteus TaxID=1452487 RepID=A0A165G587_9NEIS|nr:poly-beta-1,6-N-acetyl-D-glucosamine synthase [Crenobacter luteus]KZE35144.1 poly-beta-1,6 N-acetyl-D-glucosamine synthase [Crenobacter luteus]TCP12448.1 biofilm PGA synthesis N-glycosyltransferase PgaC [Crenobacter luteus]
MNPTLSSLWGFLLGYVFYYPLLMSYLWMLGAALYYWRRERFDPPFRQPVRRPDSPPVSVLIPCYNEGDNAEETVLQALALDYPEFEVIAINDGSRDNTGAVLDRLAAQQPRLKVVHLAQNQGKAVALTSGSLLARYDILLCIDGDALLDARAAHWLVRHFVDKPRMGAVTGNPRIRNRSTLLGRVQVGEFSSIVGMIKRAQMSYGRLFTVSGVITAFRKRALRDVGYWSSDMMTEDIDISWKLQRRGWDIAFEPNALVWILMPETLKGLWKQRLRWAQGGAQVLLKNADVLGQPRLASLWPLYVEYSLSVAWSYAMLLLTLLWLLDALAPAGLLPALDSPLLPASNGLLLGATCLAQFALSKWLDSRYDRGLGRNYYWMIWYPLVFWIINTATTVAALPKALLRRRGQRARWISPDRGIRA